MQIKLFQIEIEQKKFLSNFFFHLFKFLSIFGYFLDTIKAAMEEFLQRCSEKFVLHIVFYTAMDAFKILH